MHYIPITVLTINNAYCLNSFIGDTEIKCTHEEICITMIMYNITDIIYNIDLQKVIITHTHTYIYIYIYIYIY